MKLQLLAILLFFAQNLAKAQSLSSHFVRMDDGVNLAVDVHLPAGYSEGRLPVLIQFERYWRSSTTPKTKNQKPTLSGREKYFNENGYVIVIVDTRGSGASFGYRSSEYSPDEVMDGKEVVDWVVAQPWSNGNIGAYGTSYTGTTAELLCATKHPSIKAVIPGWSDFDIYRSPVRPYGLLASSFILKWGRYVKLLDQNRSLLLRSSIYPVHKDSLKPALEDHKDNVDLNKFVTEAEFRNSFNGEYSYKDCSVTRWKKEIEESKVPMFILASWMDAGTAEGTIQRLEHFSNPQKILLMATSHGGWCNASPFVVENNLMYPSPMVEEQNKMMLDFFDHYVKGIDKGVEAWPLIRYYNMSEETYKTSNEWPIPGTVETPFYFQQNDGLSTEKPTEVKASDDYKVDFGVSTSKKNRWTTQMGGPVLELNDRNEMDERMLVYTSSPVNEDIQITGTPVVTVHLSSTHEDGAILAYLEDVDENGKSTYITEGGLRLIHRMELYENDKQFNMHTYNKEEAQPMFPGEVAEASFKMWPTSVLIKKGHSIRIAIAGADKSTFDRVPEKGTPTYTIHRNVKESSFITLPVVQK